MEQARRIYEGYTDWLTLPRVAAELQIDYKRVLGWPKRENDPLPVRIPDENTKQCRVKRAELDEWLDRNWMVTNA